MTLTAAWERLPMDAADEGNTTLLVLLDRSAAFDMVDYKLPLDPLGSLDSFRIRLKSFIFSCPV